jgi:HPt (histidine-containing phosphotransfer) domain-containing protein
MMKNMALGMEQKDFKSLKDHAHQLKGASGNIGAGRIHEACYHIQ